MNHGFSLTELMVTIAIISALTTLAMPSYGRYKVASAHAEVKTRFAAIHSAQELWLLENNSYTEDVEYDLGFTFPADDKYLYLDDQIRTPSGIAKAKVINHVEFQMVALSKQRLASCSKAAVDTWCLTQEKVITNKQGNNGRRCPPDHTVDGGC